MAVSAVVMTVTKEMHRITKHLENDEIKENELGEECSMHGGKEECMRKV